MTHPLPKDERQETRLFQKVGFLNLSINPSYYLIDLPTQPHRKID
jgi:hypothetical protein